MRKDVAKRAVMSGVRAARGEWIATLDGDGQNDPADIPNLLAVARDPAQPKNLQLIAAGASSARTPAQAPVVAHRQGVRSRMLGMPRPTPGAASSSSRARLSATAFFNHMHRFLPALVRRNGGATISVAVHHRPRTRGVSNYGLHNRLWSASSISLA